MDNEVYVPDYDVNSEQKTSDSSTGSHIIDFIQSFVIIGAIFVSIYLFIAQPHKVSGSSMVPTFQNGDYILTDTISYKFKEPKKGDVIVLKNPRNESQDFIKRIVATPGDKIKIENNTVYINENSLNEPYIPSDYITRGGNFLAEEESINIGQDQYFVMGDNRSHSSDSREWGTVSKKEIIGKVFFRYIPLNKLGII